MSEEIEMTEKEVDVMLISLKMYRKALEKLEEDFAEMDTVEEVIDKFGED